MNAIAKTCEDQVHSSGSSSQNVAAPLPKLDVLRTLAKFPLIDTDGDLTAISMCVSTANPSADFYNSIERFAAFGPQFQRLKKLRGTPYEGVAVISISSTSDR